MLLTVCEQSKKTFLGYVANYLFDLRIIILQNIEKNMFSICTQYETWDRLSESEIYRTLDIFQPDREFYIQQLLSVTSYLRAQS